MHPLSLLSPFFTDIYSIHVMHSGAMYMPPFFHYRKVISVETWIFINSIVLRLIFCVCLYGILRCVCYVYILTSFKKRILEKRKLTSKKNDWSYIQDKLFEYSNQKYILLFVFDENTTCHCQQLVYNVSQALTLSSHY